MLKYIKSLYIHYVKLNVFECIWALLPGWACWVGPWGRLFVSSWSNELAISPQGFNIFSPNQLSVQWDRALGKIYAIKLTHSFGGGNNELQQ